MSLRTHEHTINTALSEVLQDFGKRWHVLGEKSGGTFTDGKGRPDILITTTAGWPVIIEAEFNRAQGEKEALSRLGRKVSVNANPIECSIALVYPEQLRELEGSKLREKLRETNFDYAIFFAGADGSKTRLPAEGFLTGSIHDLVFAVNKADLSTHRISLLTEVLEDGIKQVEATLRRSVRIGSKVGKALAATLAQKDDESGQTRKMALVVITNALVFHEQLATVELKVPDGKKTRAVLHPTHFRAGGQFQPTLVIDEWARILEINYYPIFYTAKLALSAMPVVEQAMLLDNLWRIAEALVAGGVTKSHDMTGVIFQRLIADRNVLKTFYTRPSCASLLVGLAMPFDKTRPLQNRMRIGDFACGTGTLLSTAYNRFSALHEIRGEDSGRFHADMMKDGLVGLDVLNVSVHLTAAMLAGSHPGTSFKGECLLTMPYGIQKIGRSRLPYLGSLDLLADQHEIDLFEKAVHTAGGSGAKRIEDAKAHLTGRSFDLVIMNPPFTRSGKRADGDADGTVFTAFSAFEASKEDQEILSKELSKIAKGIGADGNAGMAPYFVVLGEKMVKPAGKVAFVLPLSAASGSSWDTVRDLWRDNYTDILITTIASDESTSRSFSADTGMAECLVVARRRESSESPSKRAHFAVIYRQPRSSIEGELLAQAITQARAKIKKLEDGPIGGTPIKLGTELVGELLDCGIANSAQWPVVGISDFSLAQTAFSLTKGELSVAGFLKLGAKIPITSFDGITTGTAPYHLDIDGKKPDNTPRGPFDVIDGCSSSADYPCLWAHDANRERCLEVLPDTHCTPKEGVTEEHIETIWSTASLLHYCCDLQFNSQSLVAAMTPVKSIGGRAWPSVRLKHEKWSYALALWCNSSLGLLCHWWVANKTQKGRGCVTITTIPDIPTLNVSKLSAKQHALAKKKYIELMGRQLLPLNQIDEDANRELLDRALIVDVLGLSEKLCAPGGPIEMMRKKLSNEPQIDGGKKSKVVFAEDSAVAV